MQLCLPGSLSSILSSLSSSPSFLIPATLPKALTHLRAIKLAIFSDKKSSTLPHPACFPLANRCSSLIPQSKFYVLEVASPDTQSGQIRPGFLNLSTVNVLD